MGLAAVDRSLLAAMSFVQHIRDQMLFIEWLERRKNPGSIAPGSQQCWMETSVGLLHIIRLLSQPSLNISATFITCLPGGFGLRIKASSSTLTHTRLYFLEIYCVFQNEITILKRENQGQNFRRSMKNLDNTISFMLYINYDPYN